MNYKNCECVLLDMEQKKCNEAGHNTSMTEKVKAIRGSATDVGTLAYRLRVHLFGQKESTENAPSKKEPTCIDDDIENIVGLILEAVEILNEICIKVGC